MPLQPKKVGIIPDSRKVSEKKKRIVWIFFLERKFNYCDLCNDQDEEIILFQHPKAPEEEERQEVAPRLLHPIRAEPPKGRIPR